MYYSFIHYACIIQYEQLCFSESYRSCSSVVGMWCRARLTWKTEFFCLLSSRLFFLERLHRFWKYQQLNCFSSKYAYDLYRVGVYVSGTGKTATFAVSILQKIDVQLAECQALVLAPTRELAQQIVKVVRALGDYMQLQVCWTCAHHCCVSVEIGSCTTCLRLEMNNRLGQLRNATGGFTWSLCTVVYIVQRNRDHVRWWQTHNLFDGCHWLNCINFECFGVSGMWKQWSFSDYTCIHRLRFCRCTRALEVPRFVTIFAPCRTVCTSWWGLLVGRTTWSAVGLFAWTVWVYLCWTKRMRCSRVDSRTRYMMSFSICQSVCRWGCGLGIYVLDHEHSTQMRNDQEYVGSKAFKSGNGQGKSCAQ